mmetsp:Transcript_47344/g.152004  ORF Transcript_47344/g.152004 Transcript_47344/m.152004 type:complete len:250 (-) Transcript_47344:1392-2141(-)
MAPRHGSGRRDGAAAVACLNSSSNTSCGSLVALGMRHPATPLLGGSSCSPAPPGRCCSSPCLPAASPMAPCSRSRCVASATALPRITDPHAAANAMSPASSLLIRAAHPAAAAGAHRDSSRTVVFSLTVGARMALERVYPTKQAKGFQLTWTGNGGRDLESAFVKGCAAAEDLLLLTPSQGHVSKAPVWRRLPHHRPQLLLLQRPRSLLSRLLSLPLAPPRKLLVLGFAQAVVTVRKTGLSQAAACYGV